MGLGCRVRIMVSVRVSLGFRYRVSFQSINQ